MQELNTTILEECCAQIPPVWNTTLVKPDLLKGKGKVKRARRSIFIFNSPIDPLIKLYSVSKLPVLQNIAPLSSPFHPRCSNPWTSLKTHVHTFVLCHSGNRQKSFQESSKQVDPTTSCTSCWQLKGLVYGCCILLSYVKNFIIIIIFIILLS